VEGRVLFYY